MAERGTLALSHVGEAEQRIEDYFDSRMARRMVFVGIVEGEKCYEPEEYMKPPTIAGLALALGIDRRTLLRYGKGEGTRDPELSRLLTRAKLRCAEWWEEALAVREASNGARFALEVNYGYSDDEDEKDPGAGFTMNVIPPANTETVQQAIPKWAPLEDE